MTREEAIEIIKDEVMCKGGWISQLSGESKCIVEGRVNAFKMAIQALENVRENVKGEWEVVDEEEPRRYGCSVCHCLSWDGWSNFCPNCGAEMSL